MALSPQVQTHANHETPGIDGHGRLSEVRALPVVGGKCLLGALVERVQHIQQQLDLSCTAERDALRQTEIDEGLRGQPPASARLEQHALVALRQGDLCRDRPWLPAEVLSARRKNETRARHS